MFNSLDNGLLLLIFVAVQTSRVHPIIMKEMRAFRQYKNSLVELVLFVYNSCLHFDKL